MDESLKNELYFLIAKLLKSEFPTIGNLFIHECEVNNMFPSLVFNDHPSFDLLEKTSLSDIPDDQLVKLIQLSCPHSQFPSLFFNPSKSLSKPSLATCLSSHIFPNVSPVHNMNPQIRVIGHSDSVYCLAFDITNQLLITGSDDNNIKIWDYSSNTLMESFHYHSLEITDVQVHPSNEFFATCSLDCSISVISLHDLSLINSLNFDSEVHIIRFSPDGKYMAVALDEGNVKILKVPTYENYFTIPSPKKKAVAWLSFSPAGEFLIFSADPHDLVIFSMNTFKMEKIRNEHSQLPDFVSFSRHNCKQIISCSYEEHCVKVWEFDDKTRKWLVPSNGNLVLRHPNTHKVKVFRACFNCDDSNIVAISKNCISCWDTQTKALINTSTNEIFTEHCTALAMHPSLPNIAFIGCASGRASIWDTNLGEVIAPLQIDDATKITEAIWSNDGLSIVAGDEKGGYTKFSYGKQPFISINQFFLSEFTNNPQDHTIITDILQQPLDPQPKMSKISDFQLGIKLPEIRKESILEEEQISKKIMSIDVSYSSDDIEEHQIEDFSPSPVPNRQISSRMSTRHSSSVYENLEYDIERYSDSLSSPVYNTRSVEKRRKLFASINNKRNKRSDDDTASYSPITERRTKKEKSRTRYQSEYESQSDNTESEELEA